MHALCLIVVEVLHDTWKKQQPFRVISHVIHYLVIVILYLVVVRLSYLVVAAYRTELHSHFEKGPAKLPHSKDSKKSCRYLEFIQV